MEILARVFSETSGSPRTTRDRFELRQEGTEGRGLDGAAHDGDSRDLGGQVAQQAVTRAAAHEVELVGGLPRGLGELTNRARVTAGERLDDDAHVPGHGVGACHPLGVQGLVDLALHVAGGGEGLLVGVEGARGGGQLAGLGDQLVGVGGRALALPLALDFLKDPHAGDVEEGTHSPVGATLVRNAEVEGGVAHEGFVLNGTQDRPGAAGQEVGALALLDGQAVDRARGVVGATAHDGQGFEAGNRAGADNGPVGGQLAEPAARDTETVEDLVVKVASARGEQAGGRGNRARPTDDARQSVREIVGQEEGRRDAPGVSWVFLQIGEDLIRRVDRRRLITGQVKELAVANALAESIKGTGSALVAVGDDIADEFTVLIEGGPVHAPGINGNGAGIGEAFEGLLQAGDRLGLHRGHVPREGAVVPAARLVLETVDVRDIQAAIA